MTEIKWPQDYNAPFFLPGDSERAACLLIHGFTGSPGDLRPIAAHLSKLGLTCQALVLSGHSGDAELLNQATQEDWRVEVEEAALALRETHPRLIIIGLSFGGVLTLQIAAESPDLIDAIVLLGTPHQMSPRGIFATNLYRLLGRPERLRFPKKTPRPSHLSEAFPPSLTRLKVFPMDALIEVKNLIEEVQGRLQQIDRPVLILHGQHDPTIPCSAAFKLSRELASPDNQLVILRRSLHVLPLDVDVERLLEVLEAFVAKHA